MKGLEPATFYMARSPPEATRRADLKADYGRRLVHLAFATCRFSPPMARVLYVLGALLLLGAAAFAFLVAGVVNWLACENEGTEACSRQDLASAQFILAMIGLVPALVLVVAAAFGRKRMAALALAVGVPLYLAWAFLMDAAVHGWDDLKLVP